MSQIRIAGKLLFCTICLLFSKTVSAQIASKNDLLNIIAAADTFRSVHPIEKLYLQFDKPAYSLGDTIWFKAYLFNAAHFLPADKSGAVYIELTNDSNTVVKRMMAPVAGGLSWGNIALDEKDLPEGNYTLTAYTRWMCNFGGDYVFKKRFYFGSTTKVNWLVKHKVALIKDNDTWKASVKLQFNKLNSEPVVLGDMELGVADGKKVLYKNMVQTKTDGSLDLNLTLKSPVKQITLVAEDKTKGDAPQKLIIPIAFNRPENMDLQFMPEGGFLVAGLPACMGFKAIGEDGKATETEGEIFDSRKQLVASFKSAHRGMGSFYMTPIAGETYTATVNLPGGAVKTYVLPAAKTTGTVLKVRAVTGADSLIVTVTGTDETGAFFLVGQARGIVCYAAAINLANHAFKTKITTSLFPSGIVRFTLLSTVRQSLNERIVFINHHDNLQIAINSDKPAYNNRDSVALQVQVSDKTGKPIKGNFSVAVTDDALVKTDSLSADNLVSNLLLTSDLKGDVDEPGYYFQPDPDGSIKQHLDDLLLTQGWTGYSWTNVFGPAIPILYAAEPDFEIKGKVTNIFNKGIKNTHVVIFSKKPTFVLDTLTDKQGRFTFRNIVPLDTPVYLIQARNRSGRSFNVGVDVDEFKPPVFKWPARDITPWYVNGDTTLMNYVKNSTAKRNEQEKLVDGHMLKEVVIKEKKIIKDSQNLNGPGNADIVIDEEELEKAGKTTFLDLLQEKVKGFKEGFFLLVGRGHRVIRDRALFLFVIDKTEWDWKGNESGYFINDKPVKFIIDGIPLYQVLPVNYPVFVDITDYLKSHSAEDIKGIEVNSSTKYALKYIPSTFEIGGPNEIGMSDMAFIEITTRSGGGPGIHNTPGTYLYRPLSFSLPAQFYNPRYTVKNKDTLKDYRSTIYWQPNVVTDNNGKATISFYTADKTGTYTVILEGTDFNGNLGSKRSKIIVAGK